MSFKLAGIVIEDLVRNISAYEKLILIAYTSFAWKDGSRIFPSQAAVAEIALCSDRAVRAARDKFLRDGVFVEVGKKRLTKEYRFILDRSVEMYGRIVEAEPCSGLGEGNAEHGSGSIAALCSGDVESHDSKAERGSGKAERGSRNPIINPLKNPVKNPSAREGGEPKLPPTCAHWKKCMEDIRGEVGDKNFNAWIKPLIVESDDGVTICFAVSTSLFSSYIADNFLSCLQKKTGREITFVVRGWAGFALEREQRQSAIEQHRGDHP